MHEQINALQGLIGNLVTNAQDIIPKLGGSKIIGAKCNIVDVNNTNGSSKRCYLQIQTVCDVPPAQTSSASIVEITEEIYEEVSKPKNITNKRKKNAVVDESLCRRSDRLAKITMGFKDKASALAASSSTSAKENGKKIEVAVNLGPKFDAMIIDKTAPPPPPLPLKTLQAIGTGPCKMNANDV